MSFMEDVSSDLGEARQSKLESFLFSCELSSKVPFYTFQGDEEEDLEHFLELRTVCLGEGVKEESNVVEVTAMNHQGKTISVPIANLHISCLPMVEDSDLSDEEDEDDDEEDEEEEEEITPIKPAKKKQKQ
ncbi:Nucleoplasmin-like protein NO29 NOVA [Collichthys lucidus]|uniref:Nucleoplasmin-like protein NO29 NOVA n=1 Tax=Collichthys lucidus TaxID=240159 RepID=A0A4V6ARS6_COLLU|nr:Nucleoplasmin-like protein NO29 NOVA [Collichthys lucidus]